MWSMGLLMGCLILGPVGQPSVGIVGSLRNLMHGGSLVGQVELASVTAIPQVYGLGAVAGLAGEILIWDGQVMVSRVVGDAVVVDGNEKTQAALLVYGAVPDWVRLTAPVNRHALVETLKAYQTQEGIDAPLVFRLEGKVRHLAWHVIDTPSPGQQGHAAHREAGVQGVLENTAVEILGFFSEQHEGVFTHRDNPLHMHVRTPDGRLVGHVDELVPGAQMQLFTGVPFLPNGDVE